MAKDPERVSLEQIDWVAVFPFTRIFTAFRMAIWPPAKLLLALLLITLLWIGAGLLDAVAGPRVYPGEIEAYQRETRDDFAEWINDAEKRVQARLLGVTFDLPRDSDRDWRQIIEQPDRFVRVRQAVIDQFDERVTALDEQHAASKIDADELQSARAQLERQRRDRLASITALESTGVFSTALRFKLDAFERMVAAAIGFNFGFSELASSAPLRSDTVFGALRDLAITLPAWMFHRHFALLIVWCLFAMILWSLIGGAISRMAALHATRGEGGSASEALRFARQRWIWFIITPWLPLFIALMLGLVIAATALLFNVPLLNILSGAAFFVLLLLGFLIAMAMIFVAIGSGLFYPAIAVEGTDSFDALSRAGNYVFGRFWHWLFYTIVSLVYGAVCYLILGTVLFLTLRFTRWFAQLAVFTRTEDGRNTFDVMFPEPQLGQLYNSVEWSQLDITAVAAAGLVTIWIYLFIGLLAAFAISYYFAAHTWIYLLLRRAADGTELDEVYFNEPPAQALPAPEKVEQSGQSPVEPMNPNTET